MLGGIIDKADLSEEICRKIKILDEDPSIEGAVECGIEGVYIDRAEARKIMAPVAKKDNPTDADEERFRNAIVLKGFRSWYGITFPNLCRLSDWVFTHRNYVWEELQKQGLKNKKDEVPYDSESALWLANKLNPEHFIVISEGLMKQDDWVLQALADKKK